MMKTPYLRLAGTISCWLAIVTGATMLWAPWASAAETTLVERLDGSLVKILIERPKGKIDIPIVLFIDGSGCVSAERTPFQRYSRLPEGLEESAAIVFVDKSGVTPLDDGSNCSQTFIDTYSLDQRVFDHLRAIQHLRKHASWWNRQILLFGWSEGGTIGVSIAAYTPEVKRAVFGGTGGGMPMTTQFEDFVLCTPDRTEDREICIKELRKMYDEIRANPSARKTWFGDSNTYKAWAARLDAVEHNLIKDIGIPLLFVHGELDRDNVPVEATREMVRLLGESGGVDFEYWEVPGMGHGTRSLGEERGNAVRLAMLNWLLGQPLGIGGPPSFGRSLVE